MRTTSYQNCIVRRFTYSVFSDFNPVNALSPIAVILLWLRSLTKKQFYLYKQLVSTSTIVEYLLSVEIPILLVASKLMSIYRQALLFEMQVFAV